VAVFSKLYEKGSKGIKNKRERIGLIGAGVFK